jgi:nitrate/nitrite transporter NarK
MGTGLPTEIRASAIGFASAIGKIGSISMPFIVMYLYNIGRFIPFLAFALCALLGSLQTMLFLKDEIKLSKQKRV